MIKDGRIVRKFHRRIFILKQNVLKLKISQFSLQSRNRLPLIGSEESQVFDSHKNSSKSSSQYEINKLKELKTYSCGVGLGKSPENTIEKESCGEDAFFTFNSSTHSILGVADGVGGWKANGYVGVAAMVSNRLMLECLTCCENGEKIPRIIMQQVFEKIVEDNLLHGSSTICVASIDKIAKRLKVCNLGDSQLLVIRNGEIILETKQQADEDEVPYQFYVSTPASLQYSRCDCYNLNLLTGDIILLFTDGVSDNLFPSEILKCCKDFETSFEIAYQIVKQSKEKAIKNHSIRFPTPFSIKHKSFRFSGKDDDITCVCQIID